MKFDVIRANIVDVPADAVVLPANEKLKEGSGTSRAIFQAAGRRELTEACRKIGHCAVGNAVPTPAYHLKANYIIHTVVPKWRGGNQNEYDLLCSAYLSALYIADSMGCRQIAFPLLASGNNGFDLHFAWEIAVKSLTTFKGHRLKKAFLIVYGDKAAAMAEKEGYNVVQGNVLSTTKKVNSSSSEAADNFKKLAQNFIEKQLENGMDWIQKPQNQKKLLDFGASIVAVVLKGNTRNSYRRS